MTTIGLKPELSASVTLARTQPLVVQPATSRVSTPALVLRRAPRPVTFTVRGGTTAAGAYGTFTFDPLTSDLAFNVRVAPAAAARLQAVVIRRSDSAGTRVIQRVMGPAMTNGSGHLRLTGADLAAFHAGRVTLATFTSAGAGPVAEVPLLGGR